MPVVAASLAMVLKLTVVPVAVQRHLHNPTPLVASQKVGLENTVEHLYYDHLRDCDIVTLIEDV